jgi:hypothetical protein
MITNSISCAIDSWIGITSEPQVNTNLYILSVQQVYPTIGAHGENASTPNTTVQQGDIR